MSITPRAFFSSSSGSPVSQPTAASAISRHSSISERSRNEPSLRRKYFLRSRSARRISTTSGAGSPFSVISSRSAPSCMRRVPTKCGLRGVIFRNSSEQ